MGTPGFIAPEIIDGAESDEMSDWWSVASVLAFAATGEPVFGTKPMMAVLERAAAGSANLAGLPAGTMAAFRSALDPDRTKRCTPDELLQAIALDALNPQAWISGNTSDAADSAGSEAMLPFDGSPDNPRMLWRALDHVTGEDAIGTRTLPQFVEATQAIGATVIADITDTVIADAPDAGTSVMDINAHTATIPLGTGTRVLPVNSGDTSVLPQDTPQSTRVMPVQDAWNPAQEAAQIDPAIKPALQRIANQRPPAVIPNASVEMAQSAQPQDMQTSAVPTAPVTPAAPLNPNVPQSVLQPPNPADVQRGELLGRGVPLCVLMAIPVAACGLFSPWIALIAGSLLAWLLATIGFNMEAQLEREGRRGGSRRASTGAMLDLVRTKYPHVEAYAAYGHLESIVGTCNRIMLAHQRKQWAQFERYARTELRELLPMVERKGIIGKSQLLQWKLLATSPTLYGMMYALYKRRHPEIASH